MALRYRRNINCLTSDQLHDLREAYQALYDLPEADPESFATLGGLHGQPAPSWCDHGAPGFLTWHRAYMLAFEKALRCVNSAVTLAFWDWSSGPTTGVPAACASPTYVNRAGNTVPNPLHSGPIASAAGGGSTSRRPSIATTSFAGPAVSAQGAMSSATYNSFQGALNGPHGSVHGLTGGHMSSVPTAGFDPIFFLHHCNVDRLWWNWQQTHPAVAMPANEATHPLDPFTKPYSNSWQVGSDVQSTDALGYRYSNWCIWIPPLKVWDLVAVRFEPVMVRRFRDARLVIRSTHMPAESIEFRVFVNQPDANADTPVVDNPGFAGSIGFFGMGDMKMEHGSGDESARFDIELNLTEHLRARCGHLADTGHGEGHNGEGHDDTGHDDTGHDDTGHDDTGHNGEGHNGEGHDGEGHDEPRAAEEASFDIKIVAVDPDGRAIDAQRAHIDDIELIVD